MFLYQPQKTHGAIVLDGKHVADTLQCAHCGSQEEIVPGSGKKRGFCLTCPKSNNFICGRPLCMRVCIPMEVQLDYVDAKQNEENRKLVEQILKRYPEIDIFTKGIGLQ